MPAGTDNMHAYTGFGTVAQSIKRIHQHLILFLSTSSRVEASMSSVQEASSVLEDLKRLIATSDWSLGGLVVIGTFCLVFVALLLFAAIFGCCSSPRHRVVYKQWSWDTVLRALQLSKNQPSYNLIVVFIESFLIFSPWVVISPHATSLHQEQCTNANKLFCKSTANSIRKVICIQELHD